ncbi:MAG: hypothetical protein GPJ54_15130 [Candidatus Heimdallarchaeota archaeon]|nr:hypothetical protein [Candidatus Heimdallarchaeota archaeon]
MYFDEVITTRSHLNTKYHKNNLSIYGFEVSPQYSYSVIKLLADDLKHSQNNRISIIVQNHQIIILVSILEKKNSKTNNLQNKFAINPQIIKIHSVKIITGYGIHSLLFEDFIEMHKNTTLIFNKFNHRTLWRPYKICSLEVDSNTFSKMLDVLSNHRFIFSFNPWNGFTYLQITLIIIGSSEEQLTINTQKVRNKLNDIKTLHGELKTYQKNELRKSILQILLGVNNVSINSSPIIGYFNKLNFTTQNQSHLPKYSIRLQDRIKFGKEKKQFNNRSTHKIRDQLINKSNSHLNNIPQQLKNEGWSENTEMGQDDFMIYKHSNLLIHIIILENMHTEDNLNDFLLSGILIVFRCHANELVYVKSIMKA